MGQHATQPEVWYSKTFIAYYIRRVRDPNDEFSCTQLLSEDGRWVDTDKPSNVRQFTWASEAETFLLALRQGADMDHLDRQNLGATCCC